MVSTGTYKGNCLPMLPTRVAITSLQDISQKLFPDEDHKIVTNTASSKKGNSQSLHMVSLCLMPRTNADIGHCTLVVVADHLTL